jgi:hypothetical protein
MMNVLDRIDTTGKAIVQYKKLVSDVRLRDRIRERTQRVASICRKTEPLVTAQEELAWIGSNSALDVGAALTRLKNQLINQRDQIRADVTHVASDAFVDVLQEVTRLIDEVQQSLHSEWTRLAAEDIELPDISDDLLRSLQGLDPSFASDCQRIRETQARVVSMTSKPLPGAGDVERLRRAAEDLRAQWANLGAGTLTDDVRTFLMETAAAAGAPVARLTPKVQSWLRTHSLEGRFRIRQSTR